MLAWANRFADTWADALRYMTRALQDKPPSVAGRSSISYYSEAASICAHLAREYGWTDEHTLDLPMTRIFQYFNEIKQAKNSRVPLCNPLSDEVKARWQAAQQRN